MTVSVRVAIPGVPICEIRRYPRQDPQRALGCQRTARNGVRWFTLKFAGFWWGFRYEASRSGMARYVQMAPRVGIEPTTNGLTVRRSTAELPGNGRGRERRRILRFRPRIVKNPRGPMAHDRAAGPESKHALRAASALDAQRSPMRRPSVAPRCARSRARVRCDRPPSRGFPCCRRTKYGCARGRQIRSRGRRRRRLR